MQSNISERKRQAGTGWGPGMSFQSPSSHTTRQAPPATSQQVLSSQEPSRHTAPGAFAGVGGSQAPVPGEGSRTPEEVLRWQKPHSAQTFRGSEALPMDPPWSSSPGPASRAALLSRSVALSALSRGQVGLPVNSFLHGIVSWFFVSRAGNLSSELCFIFPHSPAHLEAAKPSPYSTASLKGRSHPVPFTSGSPAPPSLLHLRVPCTSGSPAPQGHPHLPATRTSQSPAPPAGSWLWDLTLHLVLWLTEAPDPGNSSVDVRPESQLPRPS